MAGHARERSRGRSCPAHDGAWRRPDHCGRTISGPWLRAPSLQSALHFDTLEALDLVARLDVVVLLDADAALGVHAHLVDVLLEAAQRFQLALDDDGVVAQHADGLVPLDHALDHHAAGDRA